jgi:hypothetical protein
MQRPWNRPRPPSPTETCVTFHPLAWLKLLFFCHAAETEIGGFGISAPDDLLYVQEFVTVRQEASFTNVRFADEAVADFFESCHERGIPPGHCGRLWIHTHPGGSAEPSPTDEGTFERCFGRCDWAAMLILARGGQTSCRLAFNLGPRAEVEVPVQVHWPAWPHCLGPGQPALEELAGQWQQEFDANIHRQVLAPLAVDGRDTTLALPWWDEEPRILVHNPFDPRILEEGLHQ